MMDLIHISHAGPVYRIRCGNWTRFEDHHYCGPIFVDRHGEPLTNQPKSTDAVWSHVNAWYQQGRKFKALDGEKWAEYTTDRHQTRREVCAERRALRDSSGGAV